MKPVDEYRQAARKLDEAGFVRKYGSLFLLKSPSKIDDAWDEDIQYQTVFVKMPARGDDGEFFEAHEVWEDIWHIATGDRKRFYQGLIQCAVTIEHTRRGNPRGVRSVWRTCVTKFENLPTVYMGIRVTQLLQDMSTFIEPVLTLPPSAFDPATPRGQNLPVNLSNAPKITLEYNPFDN